MGGVDIFFSHTRQQKKNIFSQVFFLRQNTPSALTLQQLRRDFLIRYQEAQKIGNKKV